MSTGSPIADALSRAPGTAACHLLRADDEFAASLPAQHRAGAEAALVAPVIELPRGPWSGLPQPLTDGIGVLVLSGLLLRSVEVEGRAGAELIGPGDLLRPWSGEELTASLPHIATWRALEVTRLAVLDARVTSRMAAYPATFGVVAQKAIRRARATALLLALVSQPKIHLRLHLLLWHLAERWGRVRPEGVLVRLRITHGVLAELVAAQRPSVTLALRKLSESGQVEMLKDGWLLKGDPPSILAAPGEQGASPDDGPM